MTQPFQTLEEIADDLFESIPVGEVHPFELIKLIKEFHSRLLAAAETKELVEKGKHQSRIEELEAKLSKVREELGKLEYFDELEIKDFKLSYDWVKKMDVDAILRRSQ